MEIIKVYKTSKGLFWTKEEAEKKKNREKEKEFYNTEYQYEQVREVYVLIANVEVDAGVRGFGNVSMAFELNPVEVR
jgi:hypothetical protein